MDIGKRLRQLRLAEGLSQGDIERRSGLDRSYVSRVEREPKHPSLDTLEKWAKALRVEPYELSNSSKRKPKVAYSPDEKHLVQAYRDLAVRDQRLLMAMVRTMTWRGDRRC